MTTWRQQQAAGTRRQIVRTARRLFVASGYASTTVEAIAAEAGVALATVYKAFGSKAAIALELNDLIDEEAATAGFAERIAAETNPAELIRLSVALNRSLRSSAAVTSSPRSARPPLSMPPWRRLCRRHPTARRRRALVDQQAGGRRCPGPGADHHPGCRLDVNALLRRHLRRPHCPPRVDGKSVRELDNQRTLPAAAEPSREPTCSPSAEGEVWSPRVRIEIKPRAGSRVWRVRAY